MIAPSRMRIRQLLLPILAFIDPSFTHMQTRLSAAIPLHEDRKVTWQHRYQMLHRALAEFVPTHRQHRSCRVLGCARSFEVGVPFDALQEPGER